MQLDEKAVRRIIDEVWTLVLSADAGTSSDDPAGADDRVLVGSVHMSGAWEGEVAVRCSVPLARLIASRIYGLGDEKPTETDTHRALGEIAHLIGGNIRGLITGPARLSPPLVLDAVPGSLALLESDGAASTTWFSTLGHPFAVTVSLRARAIP